MPIADSKRKIHKQCDENETEKGKEKTGERLVLLKIPQNKQQMNQADRKGKEP
ncbi:hypothetical protein [Janthinobacterium sp. GW458P]|uniref:hypothetical protein n=1 Tax=Janthinobacterium sp. GW458P TaxID=1981504 RepID=UPI0012FD41FA|nr:hypothetical protein [Janthinobacterium sp. GW458P]